jgi:crossover junction endodeoxyribonuclease RuvC
MVTYNGSSQTPSKMIALGIDPGTRRIGYGLVRREGSDIVYLAAGTLDIKSESDAPALVEAKNGARELIKQYRPEALGIEKLFFAKNRKTAMAVAQARGAILLAAQEAGLPIKEYAPNEVKLGIAGYGFADKKAMLKMVRLILKKPDLAVIDDASDALALAIMACGH